MNEMQVFQNSEFGELGVLEIEGKPYFPATACAKKLGYVNPQKAIRDHCRGVNEMVTPTNGGTQTMRFIPEGDLYRLITHSKLPAAERFEKWVFDEVLPTIRKTGSYGNQIGTLAKTVEQLAEAVAAIMQAASTCMMVANKLTEVAERLEQRMDMIEEHRPKPLTPVDCITPAKCKLETFPANLTEQVDGMLEDMLRQQALNFSMIARYCTMNGYTITSPAVKTYYLRHFNEA